jgi:hypothetical protein
MSHELDAQAGHHSIGLDDLNAGIYFIRLTQKGGEPQMFKWVKM